MLGYIEAKKQSDGMFQLFYRGTRNNVEGFEGKRYATAAMARRAYKESEYGQEQTD